MKRLLLLALALVIFATPALSAVPRTLNVQGVLVDAVGNPLPDATYTVDFQLWNKIGNGTLIWTEQVSVSQFNGVFGAVLGKVVPLNPDQLNRRLYLSMVIDGGTPTSPRIEMTPVASSLMAATVAPDAAVRSLNGLTNNVKLQGGTNVSITQVDTTLVISAIGGAGGDDGDWDIIGNSLGRSSTGPVAIGTTDAHNFVDIGSATTLQISSTSWPALCLDAISNGSLTRWTALGTTGPLSIRKASSYNSFGVRSVSFDDGLIDFFDAFDDPKIKFRMGDEMTTGSSINLYGTSSGYSLIDLDTAKNSGDIGGTITLRDANGESEVVITANHNNSAVGRVITPVLEITGGSDLSEQFDMGDVSAITKPGMVVSIDPSRPGKITLSDGAYDRKVAGVISGAGGVNTGMMMGQKGSLADGEYPVALVGRVYVWADASNGPIIPGDMLTTSDLPGHAMKVLDHDQATGAVLGKAMTGLAEGQGLILTLVSLQ